MGQDVIFGVPSRGHIKSDGCPVLSTVGCILPSSSLISSVSTSSEAGKSLFLVNQSAWVTFNSRLKTLFFPKRICTKVSRKGLAMVANFDISRLKPLVLPKRLLENTAGHIERSRDLVMTITSQHILHKVKLDFFNHHNWKAPSITTGRK
jgi:hypothetical protein